MALDLPKAGRAGHTFFTPSQIDHADVGLQFLLQQIARLHRGLVLDTRPRLRPSLVQRVIAEPSHQRSCFRAIITFKACWAGAVVVYFGTRFRLIEAVRGPNFALALQDVVIPKMIRGWGRWNVRRYPLDLRSQPRLKRFKYRKMNTETRADCKY